MGELKTNKQMQTLTKTLAIMASTSFALSARKIKSRSGLAQVQ